MNRTSTPRRPTWYRPVLISVVAVAIPLVLIVVQVDVHAKPAPVIVGAWILSIFVGFVVASVEWCNWLRTNELNAWIRRSLVAGFIFGTCFGNAAFPIAGMVVGIVVGPFIGLGAGLLALGLSKLFNRKLSQSGEWLSDTALHRQMQHLSIGLIVFGVLCVLALIYPYFNEPVSKYISKGEYQRIFLSTILWPAALLILYLLVAGPPSKTYALFGETTRFRKGVVLGIVLLALVSSFCIGFYWAMDNFPHPD